MLARSQWWRLALIAGCVILAYDTLASSASRLTGIPYGRFAVASYLLQIAAAFVARRSGSSAMQAVLLASWVGIVEATIGWGISWLIGPGHPTAFVGPATVVAIAIIVAVTASVCGGFGAALASIGRPSSPREA